MIPRHCKRLAEVDFPIAAVSQHAAREKSIRHGHPSTLHLWWARRPLASSRAVLLALLLPDPCDPACPAAFMARAREILTPVRQRPKDAAELRKALIWFIGTFADWNLAADPTYLRVARDLVRAAHPGGAPLVVDPFAGGGSIPLEALRVGCEAFASDLNPVACLILKVMLEDIPRHGPGLAEELRRVGAEVKAAAEKELADLYPPDPDGAAPIAYLWARTVRCEAPNCGAEIPLLRSFWLCRKPKRRRALRAAVARPAGEPPRVELEVFEPASERDVRAGTVTRAKAACPCCGVVLPPERVRAQLAAQRGGADAVFDEAGRRVGGARLTAVVTLRPGEMGRHYRPAAEADYAAVRAAQARLAGILGEWERGGKQGFCPVPDEPLPPIGTLGFRVQRYGMLQWSDLFTARQKVALVALGNRIALAGRNFPERPLHSRKSVRTPSNPRLSSESALKTGNSFVQLLSCGIGKRADYASSGTKWHLTFEKTTCTFGRQAIPMTWDFVEPIPIGETSGAFGAGFSSVYSAVENLTQSIDSNAKTGQVQQNDATNHALPDQAAGVWFTDPPYYDAIPYSDLSDFFLVWLKRALPDHPLLRDPFDPANPLSPKTREAVQDETKTCGGRVKDRAFFEDTMGRAFTEGRRVLHEDGIGSVVFAHKTTEGWEALLAGMIRGGWTITGSWPIATERPGRLRSQDSAALATSIHLVCRPRPDDAPVGDWAVVLRELPERVGEWMERLQDEGVRGADLVFACVGPALEIFSRYAQVETADGGEVGLPAYLERVWEVVGRTALENVLGAAEAQARNGLAGALEEDARLTALFLWTLQATDAGADAGDAGGDGAPRDADEDGETPAGGKAQGFALVFDVVRRFAQPLGIDLPKWEKKRTIETKKGVVRLLPVAERARHLFGARGAQAVAARLEREAAAGTDPLQGLLFPDRQETAAAAVRERRPRYGDGGDLTDDRSPAPGATTLDRVHTGMLFQAGGQTNALHALLKAERERGPDFLRLSNALSALYPRGSEEKRLLDAMLLAVPR